jgi:hypothetical protein
LPESKVISIFVNEGAFGVNCFLSRVSSVVARTPPSNGVSFVRLSTFESLRGASPSWKDGNRAKITTTSVHKQKTNRNVNQLQALATNERAATKEKN